MKGGIESDVKNLPYSDEIKHKAGEIFFELYSGSVRQDNRKKAVCFCVYQASLDLNDDDVIDPVLIGRNLGITDKKSQNAITKFSSRLPPGHHTGTIEAGAIVRCYCQEEAINLNAESIIEIKEIWDEVKAKNPAILNDNPRTTVAGLIWYYIRLHDREARLTDEYVNMFYLVPMRAIISAESQIRNIIESAPAPARNRVPFPRRLVTK